MCQILLHPSGLCAYQPCIKLFAEMGWDKAEKMIMQPDNICGRHWDLAQKMDKMAACITFVFTNKP